MKLGYAMLADYAQISSGKTYIMGGGIDTLYTPSFPAILEQLAIVATVIVDPHNGRSCDSHIFSIDMLSPDNAALFPPVSVAFDMAQISPISGHLARAPFVVNLQNVRFSQAGEYVVRLYVDKQEIGRLPLLIRKQGMMPSSRYVI